MVKSSYLPDPGVLRDRIRKIAEGFVDDAEVMDTISKAFAEYASALKTSKIVERKSVSLKASSHNASLSWMRTFMNRFAGMHQVSVTAIPGSGDSGNMVSATFVHPDPNLRGRKNFGSVEELMDAVRKL